MARFVSGSATAAFGHGLFGSLSTNTMQYLQNQINQFGMGASGLRKSVYERSKALFSTISSSTAMQAAEAVLMQAEAMMGQDTIEYLGTIEQMQCAQPVMQNFIMHHPLIYQQWVDGKIEGYADTYVDPEPGRVGHDRAGYRELMHGVLQEHDTMAWKASYYTDVHPSKSRLTMRQVAAILDTQDAVLAAIEAGEEDPTSQYGASL